MTEAVGLHPPLTIPAITNPANLVLTKSQTQVAWAVGMDFLQGISTQTAAAGTLLAERNREPCISKKY